MTDHAELPIPDYDHLPVGSLTHRIRSLDAGGLATLLDYERAHGDRLPVVQLLSRRLDALPLATRPSPRVVPLRPAAGARPTGGQ